MATRYYNKLERLLCFVKSDGNLDLLLPIWRMVGKCSLFFLLAPRKHYCECLDPCPSQVAPASDRGETLAAGPRPPLLPPLSTAVAR
jgi:hypothetical protein